MKPIIISIIVAVILIGASLMFGGLGADGKNLQDNGKSNVSIVDGKQVIEINAKGGYYPRNTIAQAGLPTVLKIKTTGTFDCSSAVVIPAINYRANLPISGETVIELPAQEKGAKIQGLCSMGMYNFSLDFN